MFQGFNQATIQYLEAIRKDNSKATFREKEALYLDGVKTPLEELYYELIGYLSEVDTELCGNKRRCISTPYNDARFCKDEPMKGYFYLHFKRNKQDKKNVPGFFFDAGLDGYRYGLQVYHMDTRGMEQIRSELLDNKRTYTSMIKHFNEGGLLGLYGEQYKQNHYPEETVELQDWLNRKSVSFFHEEPVNEVFFQSELSGKIREAYESCNEIYAMLKEALI